MKYWWFVLFEYENYMTILTIKYTVNEKSMNYYAAKYITNEKLMKLFLWIYTTHGNRMIGY